MNDNDDYYKFLDVSPTASSEEIRSAFRRMAFKYHPDHNKDPWAETIFKQINEAYQVLGNPAKRSAYDVERRAEAQRAEKSQRAAEQRQRYGQGPGAGGEGDEGRREHTWSVVVCRKCGLRNHSNNNFCSYCGAILGNFSYRGGGAGPASPVVPNYLLRAILATLVCFWPAGIVSIVFAAKVNGKVKKGDMPGALRCSRNARIWFWVAFGLGIPFSSVSVWSIISQLG